ncbi:hypothetical protein Mapa_006743 [Marchantia paleacea]|nr:hypothetical protein Mapa_006743 [Marchantia paleacea]
MDYLEKNIDWLKAKLEPFKGKLLSSRSGAFNYAFVIPQRLHMHPKASGLDSCTGRNLSYQIRSLSWTCLLYADHYLLFDFPGQVELFTLHNNAKNVITEMVRKWDYRLTAVHLVDAHLCSDPGKYVGALLLSLSTMLHLELPHINVLSKIDLIESYGQLGKVPFTLGLVCVHGCILSWFIHVR